MREKILLGIFIFYFIINIVLFIMMGIDKRRAIKNKWRISEATLIITGLLGGGLGGFLGMKVFHHKTRKLYFHIGFGFGIALHIVILYFLVFKT